MGPTLAGFLTFIRNTMSINTTYLPDNSQVIVDAFAWSTEIVNAAIQQASAIMYTNAVYNLGGDYIINWAPDQTGQTYFAKLRDNFNIMKYISGVVQSSSDEGTSSSLVVPKAAETFSQSDLQNLKTPYGRMYLMIAQKYGPTIWGLN